MPKCLGWKRRVPVGADCLPYAKQSDVRLIAKEGKLFYLPQQKAVEK